MSLSLARSPFGPAQETALSGTYRQALALDDRGVGIAASRYRSGEHRQAHQSDGNGPFTGVSGAICPGIDFTVDEVRRAIAGRRKRDRFFGAGLFEEPAWDILLELFCAELERTQLSVSSLCIAAAVAPTTALRWIKKLVDTGLLVRDPDQFDRRRSFIALSRRASDMMRSYLSEMRRTGVALG